jgi:pimeloyl-ACP methyl ester carboxylesterase
MHGAARIFRFARLGRVGVLAIAGAICLGLSGCQSATVPKPVAPGWTIPPGVATQTVNGYPMAYSSRGSGPTIVFVHGVLLDYRYWQQPLETWTGDYRVVAISMRHFYPEHWDGKGDDFTISQHAKDLAAFIESIGGPVYLVGWSYGGAPAYEVARTRPDLVKKLVLVEGGPDLRPKPADFVCPRQTRPEGPRRSKSSLTQATWMAVSHTRSTTSTDDRGSGLASPRILIR